LIVLLSESVDSVFKLVEQSGGIAHCLLLLMYIELRVVRLNMMRTHRLLHPRTLLLGSLSSSLAGVHYSYLAICRNLLSAYFLYFPDISVSLLQLSMNSGSWCALPNLFTLFENLVTIWCKKCGEYSP